MIILCICWLKLQKLVWYVMMMVFYCSDVHMNKPPHTTRVQWRTEGGGGWGVQTPRPRNSEDIGGVLHRMSKKNRRLDFLL